MKPILLVMALIALALPSQGAWTDDLTLGVAYARSLEGHTAATIVTVGIPLHEWAAGPLATLSLNAEMVGAAVNTNEFQGGPGASLTLINPMLSLRIGGGYIPGDLEWCWYVGVSKPIARW